MTVIKSLVSRAPPPLHQRTAGARGGGRTVVERARPLRSRRQERVRDIVAVVCIITARTVRRVDGCRAYYVRAERLRSVLTTGAR